MIKLLQIIILSFIVVASPFFISSCGTEDPMPCIDNCEDQEEEEEGEKNG